MGEPALLRLPPPRLAGGGVGASSRLAPLAALAAFAALTVAAPGVAWARRARSRSAGARRTPTPARPVADGATAAPRGSVRGVHGELVYVALGRADGAHEGQRLLIEGHPELTLTVLHVGAHQLVARPAPASGARRAGAGVRAGMTVAPPTPASPEPNPTPKPPAALPRVRATPPAQAAARWASVRARGGPRVTFDGGSGEAGASRRRETRVRGDLTLTYGGVYQGGAASAAVPLDLHSLRLRSRLQVQRGAWDWAHDVTARLDLGPRLASRPGAGSRPPLALRRARVGYRSQAWGDAGVGQRAPQPPAGSLGARLGRLWVSSASSTGLLDGLAGHLSLGRGLTLALHGGLVPARLDLAPSTDLAAAGGALRWAWAGGPWRASAGLSADGSVWRGRFNRLDVALRGTVTRGSDAYAAARATLSQVPDAAALGDGAPGSTPSLAVSHAYVGGFVRPWSWLQVDAHWAHDRPLLDRELAARVGPLGLPRQPRESLWLRARAELGPRLALWAGGTYGFGGAESDRLGASGGLLLRHLGGLPLRVGAAYRLTQGRAVRAHVGSLDVDVDAGAAWTVGARYELASFQARLLDRWQLEHSVEARASWLERGPWRLSLTAAWVGGDLPWHARVFALVGWRFQ